MKKLACIAVAAPLLVGCIGIDAGSHYPDYSSSEARKQLLTPENGSGPSISLGSFVFRNESCEGLSTSVQLQTIAQDDLSRHLNVIGAPPAQIKASGSLYWFDFPVDDSNDGRSVRLRLAVLSSPKEAADELHKSLLQHGPGWWGLRRSNISVLAPKTSTSSAVAFALKYKLQCWGMMSVADVDDVYVVPGPYMEL